MPRPDPLEIQISVKLKLPKHVDPKTVPASLIDEVVRYRVEHGHDHPRAQTRIIRWLNPSRKGRKGQWRTGNQADAWESLGPALKEGRIRITPV